MKAGECWLKGDVTMKFVEQKCTDHHSNSYITSKQLSKRDNAICISFKLLL